MGCLGNQLVGCLWVSAVCLAPVLATTLQGKRQGCCKDKCAFTVPAAAWTWAACQSGCWQLCIGLQCWLQTGLAAEGT